mmetsp:Transcript_4132/g.15169  ORF Transcript_4132/g.15169 Transcript_4132/m.15169 type:complete len:277 (+) Transcript_4132:587-1417(+)
MSTENQTMSLFFGNKNTNRSRQSVSPGFSLYRCFTILFRSPMYSPITLSRSNGLSSVLYFTALRARHLRNRFSVAMHTRPCCIFASASLRKLESRCARVSSLTRTAFSSCFFNSAISLFNVNALSFWVSTYSENEVFKTASSAANRRCAAVNVSFVLCSVACRAKTSFTSRKPIDVVAVPAPSPCPETNFNTSSKYAPYLSFFSREVSAISSFVPIRFSFRVSDSISRSFRNRKLISSAARRFARTRLPSFSCRNFPNLTRLSWSSRSFFFIKLSR